LKALREGFGSGLRIALDANQALTRKAAIRWAAELAEFDLWWIEEPVQANDLEGHCMVREAIGCDLASGENLYGVHSAHEAIRRGAVDILMPNIQRLGGLTAWLSVAAHAEAEGIRIGAHVHPEYQTHAMCGLPGTVAVECWPGWPWIWQQPMTLRSGLIEAPVQPGIGLTPDPEFLRTYRA
jgi:L-alanine-DL-glutamate epimerase-like enolase superfamily enzyme